ncbi:hypothetical protein F7725_023172 [Dissostichus mawsoni]|uniref:Uncharacterized protein n=1 Tax=Dissostichus mawsoni TaxID=36200 RepID=A0A7J5Z2V0_DISMA|nr:hypothetical protein F7725_023172 [Dissostichus mawsoni]
MKDSIINGAYLWAAGQEGLNVDVRVVHFQIVVPETSGDSDGRQHTSLQEIRGRERTRRGHGRLCRDQGKLEVIVLDGFIRPAQKREDTLMGFCFIAGSVQYTQTPSSQPPLHLNTADRSTSITQGHKQNRPPILDNDNRLQQKSPTSRGKGGGREGEGGRQREVGCRPVCLHYTVALIMDAFEGCRCQNTPTHTQHVGTLAAHTDRRVFMESYRGFKKRSSAHIERLNCTYTR